MLQLTRHNFLQLPPVPGCAWLMKFSASLGEYEFFPGVQTSKHPHGFYISHPHGFHAVVRSLRRFITDPDLSYFSDSSLTFGCEVIQSSMYQVIKREPQSSYQVGCAVEVVLI
jgi:hypothetical protein